MRCSRAFPSDLPRAAAMLFPWPRTLERRAEFQTQACVPIVSTPVRSNPTVARRFFSANFLPATGSFPNTRDFPFSPAKATKRRTQAASRSSRVAAALCVPRSRLCLSVRELVLQLCGLQLQISQPRIRCGHPNSTLVDRGFGWRRAVITSAVEIFVAKASFSGTRRRRGDAKRKAGRLDDALPAKQKDFPSKRQASSLRVLRLMCLWLRWLR